MNSTAKIHNLHHDSKPSAMPKMPVTESKQPMAGKEMSESYKQAHRVTPNTSHRERVGETADE